MRTTKYFMMAVLTVGLASGLGVFQAADNAKPKYDIEEVMKKGMKGKSSLFAKVAGGKASKEEQQKMLDMFEALGQNKPPKGDEGDWKKRTTALVLATKDMIAGKANAGQSLRKAANCGACHKAHRED
jgi:hypothetical protein